MLSAPYACLCPKAEQPIVKLNQKCRISLRDLIKDALLRKRKHQLGIQTLTSVFFSESMQTKYDQIWAQVVE